MRQVDRAYFEGLLNKPDLPPEDRTFIEDTLRDLDAIYEANPLEGFWPHPCRFCKKRGPNPDCQKHRTPQKDFLEAQTKIVAAFAGNRFGKTTALVVKLLIQHVPEHLLPEHLLAYRFTPFKEPIMGRLYVPSEKALLEYTIPAFKKWTPKELFLGGSWDKAFDKQHNILRFSQGLGQVGIYTYQQDPQTMVGAALHYAGYDEPPPEAVRNETIMRLVDHDAPEIFALTPVNMKGGGIGYLYRQIWKKRQEPHVTVVKASIYDNPGLSLSAIEHALSQYPEEERQARAEGDFLHLGGMVYANGFEDDLCDPPPPAHVHQLDNVVGIDPGIRNAAFIFKGFDGDNVCVTWDELLLQDATVADYAVSVALKLASWGLAGEVRWHAEQILKERLEKQLIDREEFDASLEMLRKRARAEEPLYLIDPSARNRNLTDGETVEDALRRYGVHCVHAQNNVEGGVAQVRLRRQHGYYLVSRDCTGIRGEAEEYRTEDRPDGVFKVVKENDHRLDADRYATVHRPFLPPDRPEPGKRDYAVGTAVPPSFPPAAVAPTGSMT